jgi:hypothetical protein
MKLESKTTVHRLMTMIAMTVLVMVTMSGRAGAAIHQLGEAFGGGTIFYVDATQEHGLIAAPSDISGHSGTYPEGYFTWIDARANCDALTAGGYTDWHLPSITELKLLNNQKGIISGIMIDTYWSSSPSYADVAWLFSFIDGKQWDHGKQGYAYRARPVRDF